ncbi:hypothetical protein K438DRAFT_541254 [Mycena galopus ATCC 62051]|nr:hypothetical protein K438DRAFT_541254 [Mycena galopus ATCC 62051]
MPLPQISMDACGCCDICTGCGISLHPRRSVTGSVSLRRVFHTNKKPAMESSCFDAALRALGIGGCFLAPPSRWFSSHRGPSLFLFFQIFRYLSAYLFLFFFLALPKSYNPTFHFTSVFSWIAGATGIRRGRMRDLAHAYFSRYEHGHELLDGMMGWDEMTRVTYPVTYVSPIYPPLLVPCSRFPVPAIRNPTSSGRARCG